MVQLQFVQFAQLVRKYELIGVIELIAQVERLAGGIPF